MNRLISLLIPTLLLALAPITVLAQGTAKRLEHSAGIDIYASSVAITGLPDTTLGYAGVRYELSYQFPEKRLFVAANVALGVGALNDSIRASTGSTDVTLDIKGKTHFEFGLKAGARLGRLVKIYGNIGFVTDETTVDSVIILGFNTPVVVSATGSNSYTHVGFGLDFAPEGKKWGIDWRILGFSIDEPSGTERFLSSLTASYRF